MARHKNNGAPGPLLAAWRDAVCAVVRLGCRMRVATFNLLAPCYKRTTHGIEADDIDVALRRGSAAARLLSGCMADIILLQEFWFNERYKSLMEEEMVDYEFHYAQRPRQDDGVAIAVRKGSGLHVIASSPYRLTYTSSRVALILKLANDDKNGSEFLLCTTHLSFAHGFATRLVQMHEARNLLRHLDNVAQREIPILLGGDFNSDSESQTYAAIESAGYESCFVRLCGSNPPVTHRDHNGREVLADFLFTKASYGDTGATLSAKAAAVLPQAFDADSFPSSEEFPVSDHRLLSCDIDVSRCIERSSL